MNAENSVSSNFDVASYPALYSATAELTQLYDSPRAILSDPSLDDTKKRELLAEWLSDICAVESMPTLRRAPFSTRAVAFEEIMDALITLDIQHLRVRLPHGDNFSHPSTAAND